MTATNLLSAYRSDSLISPRDLADRKAIVARLEAARAELEAFDASVAARQEKLDDALLDALHCKRDSDGSPVARQGKPRSRAFFECASPPPADPPTTAAPVTGETIVGVPLTTTTLAEADGWMLENGYTAENLTISAAARLYLHSHALAKTDRVHIGYDRLMVDGVTMTFADLEVPF